MSNWCGDCNSRITPDMGCNCLNLSDSAPIGENEQGGKSTVLPVRLDLIPTDALFDIGGVFDHGAKKYEKDNWKKVPVEEHLNHALVHIYAQLKGDKQDNHLGHAATRLIMALQVKLEEDK